MNSVIARNTAAEGTALYHSTGNYFDTSANAPLPPVFTNSAFLEGETLLRHFAPAGSAQLISPPAGNEIMGDPGFAAPGNYQLRPDSLLIDRGSGFHILPGELDLAGQPRQFGSAPDIGAYEFTVAGPRILIPTGSAIRRFGGIELRATLQNGGTAPAAQMAISSIVAQDEFDQDYVVTEMHLALPQAGHLGINEAASLRLLLQPAAGTPRQVQLLVHGTYYHEGTEIPFQASQLFAITIPTQWILLGNGAIRLEFEGRLQHTATLAPPDWRDVGASGALEIIPSGTESYWRALPE